MRNVRNKWLRGAVLITFFLVFAGFILLPEVGRFAKKAALRDRSEAALQEATATVAILVPEVPDGASAPSPAQVSVRFRGAIRPVKDVPDIVGLKLNENAKIQYRVGKSGRIYVESIQSLDSGTTPAVTPHLPISAPR